MIEVPTLDGRDQLEVPRGTQSGDVLRIKGRGMPDIGGRARGDELVEIVVETPRHLTARQEELLREFAEIEHLQVSPRRKSFFEKLRDYFTEEAEPDETRASLERGRGESRKTTGGAVATCRNQAAMNETAHDASKVDEPIAEAADETEARRNRARGQPRVNPER